jgi:putative tryptophan/tyrosine transport system substrate-binding protein
LFWRFHGNVTGVSQFSTALEGKRLELLHELVPNAAVIAMLVNPTFPGTDSITNDMQIAARAWAKTECPDCQQRT